MAFWKQDTTPSQKPAGDPPPPPPVPQAAVVPPTPPQPDPAMPVLPAVRQSLGRETTVTGKLSFNAPTRIDGTLNGEVKATDLLIIGEEGLVDGAVRAQQLLVLGVVRGEVHVEGKVEIGASGKVIGSVHSRHLVVNAGGILDGDCRVPGGAAAAKPAS